MPRLYRSLCNQTSKDFEWLVIDDGSSDNTKELIDTFIKEHKIPIKYIFKENGGLYTGYNAAYAHITTELNVCIDSDDYMPDDAVEVILKTWEECGSDKYAGMTGLDFYADTDRPIGGYFPHGLKEAYLLDLYVKGIHRGDSKQVMRTDIMKRYAPMEGFEGEKNFNPIYMLLQACDTLPVLLINRNLCYVDYQKNDGMSSNIWKQYVDSPRSFAKLRLLEMSLYRSTFLNNLRCNIHYVASCIIAADNNWLKNSPVKWRSILCFVPGWLLAQYILWKNMRSKK